MGNILKSILAVSAMTIVSCQPTLVAEFQDKAVVEGYLHAGSSPEIKVSKLIAFRSDVEYSDVDITALSITITDETSGVVYNMEPAGDGIYSNHVLITEEGHTYSLYFPYNEFEVKAGTTIPPKPLNMEISARTIYVSAMPGGMPGSEDDDEVRQVDVTWENAAGDYYMVVVENIDSNPVAIANYDEDDERPLFSFRKEPVRSESTVLSQQDFSYLGRHNVILMRMQPEYVLLYQYQDSDGSNIAEVHANVENGYGIFTGTNADTLQITVRRSSF